MDVITSSGETPKIHIKHNTVPHSEYFLHRCIQILEDKGKIKEPRKLTDLWQRLSALRRYLTCLRCNQLCYPKKALTHPLLFIDNQEILFCEACFKIICKAKYLEPKSIEVKDAMNLKKIQKNDTDNINDTTALGEENKLLMIHCFDYFDKDFKELYDLEQISKDYLEICKGIIRLDKYFFPWNDQNIKTSEDFLEKSWLPFLKESVDIAHKADPEDPDSDFIYRILTEALNFDIKEREVEDKAVSLDELKIENSVTDEMLDN